MQLKILRGLTLSSHFVSIRIHGRHDVDACGVHELGDLRVAAVVTTEVLDKIEQQFSTNHLIAMHVAYILKFRFSWEGKMD